MDIYIGRQPIFNRQLHVYGYELLYRKSMNNFYEGTDDNQATAELINNAFLSMELHDLTEGTRAFINFSGAMLTNEIPFLLPKDEIVVEILERVQVTDKIIEACRRLKKDGYLLALDDFVFHTSYLPLIELADIIKVEFSVTPRATQRQLIQTYGSSKIKFLAEKVETREDYQAALDMGYDYFQGYFFSKPVIIHNKEVQGIHQNYIRILAELDQEEPDYHELTKIIEADLGLSYKFLKLANSPYWGAFHTIYSIRQALVRVGTAEIKKWVYLMMLKEFESAENKELTKNCLVRAKLMELLAHEIGMGDKHLEFFMTGLFSSIDVLLDRSMKSIVADLPFVVDVRDALLGYDNLIRRTLVAVLANEMVIDSETLVGRLIADISGQRMTTLYIEALKWVKGLEY